MIAIVLCAGYATRMYPLTENRPKPLLDVAGRPVIDYLTDQLAEFEGLETIYVVTNDRFFPQFVNWAEGRRKRLSERGITLAVYNDKTRGSPERLGAAGDLGFVVDSMPSVKAGLVAAGDNIFCFRLKPYWDKFLEEERNYVLTLPVDDIGRLRRTGVAELGEENKVTAFHEKPENPPANLACPALYFLQPRALSTIREYLTGSEAADEIGRFISYLCENDEVYALRAEGEALDIGTPEGYKNACALMHAAAPGRTCKLKNKI